MLAFTRRARAPLRLRPYRSADCGGLAQLFYDTVHSVNTADYTPQQVNAWATGEVDLADWDRSFSEHLTFVAEEGDALVGFADMALDGYLDHLFVHRDHQREGIATALCDRLEGTVAAPVYSAHASITAQPFFSRRGYRIIEERQVERRGTYLNQFVMEKAAPDGTCEEHMS